MLENIALKHVKALRSLIKSEELKESVVSRIKSVTSEIALLDLLPAVALYVTKLERLEHHDAYFITYRVLSSAEKDIKMNLVLPIEDEKVSFAIVLACIARAVEISKATRQLDNVVRLVKALYSLDYEKRLEIEALVSRYLEILKQLSKFILID